MGKKDDVEPNQSHVAAKDLESGHDDLKERREGLESINNDIAAAAFGPIWLSLRAMILLKKN